MNLAHLENLLTTCGTGKSTICSQISQKSTSEGHFRYLDALVEQVAFHEAAERSVVHSAGSSPVKLNSSRKSMSTISTLSDTKASDRLIFVPQLVSQL